MDELRDGITQACKLDAHEGKPCPRNLVCTGGHCMRNLDNDDLEDQLQERTDE